MDVTSDQIIDIGLNFIGFVAAGGFCTLLYAAVIGRGKRRSATEAAPAPAFRAGSSLSPVAQAAVAKSQPEFIDLHSWPSKSAAPGLSLPPTSSGRGDGRRHDRAEIIRLARKMVEARASDHNIQATLPISKGELAMLHRDNGR